MAKRVFIVALEIESDEHLTIDDVPYIVDSLRGRSYRVVDSTTYATVRALMRDVRSASARKADPLLARVPVDLCGIQEGCDGTGRLPNGERCDLCERYPSDAEAR